MRVNALIVPGLGRHIFSPTSLIRKGLRCLIQEQNPHLAIEDVTIPLIQPSDDQGMGTLGISLTDSNQTIAEPPTTAGPTGDIAIAAAPNPPISKCFATIGNTWHRRLGHLNFRSMDIYARTPTHEWTTRTTHPRAGYVR